ncbi:MAG: acyl-CoA dehydrogenase family protein [Acidimicrobiaceae bacterium]|nr:acyl-CoA dehydrogenase family protein [Acidimicrobiaceae bacterium]MDE0515444.1 acyl-CoA dehydrogenase family protein [Acidimicrobiaceae bacterium]
MVRHRSEQDPGGSDDTSAQAEFRARVRDWHDRHATVRSYDDLWRVPLYVDEARAEESFQNGRTWQRTLFEHGWAGLTWPRDYGGGGGEPWQARIFSEVAAGYEEWPGFIGATIAMLGPTLLRHGSEQQKLRFVPGLLSGELAFCQLFSEPGAGSDLAGLAMRAERDGDEFVVNGQKVWNSQAQFCDWGFLLVRTDPDAPKHRGITFLLVEMDSPGIEARPLVQMNGSAHFNEVFFDDVRVPAVNVVGEVDGGWAPARTVLLNESAFIGDRKGSSVVAPLSELARRHGRLHHPLVRQRLVDAWARERMQRWMGETIQNAVRRGEPPPIDPGIMKLFAAESKRRSGDLAVALGGLAVVADTGDPARWARHELMGRYAVSIGGGTNEVMRNNVAERVLGLPREPGFDRDVPWRDIPR